MSLDGPPVESPEQHTVKGEFIVKPRALRSVFKKAHEQLQRGEGIPHDRFWRELERFRGVKAKAPARGRA